MPLHTGRTNQKERTRAAIVAAAREAVATGGEVTMPEVARRALVSEATAYRYFPDLASLLREALAGLWNSPEQAMAPAFRVPRMHLRNNGRAHRMTPATLFGLERSLQATGRPGARAGNRAGAPG